MKMKYQNKFYDFWTRFLYCTLHFPIYLKKSKDRKVKNPKFTVIFLHGISADSGTWQKTFKKIISNKVFADARFVSLDLLGHGGSLKSGWLKYDYEEMAKALENSIKKYRLKGPIVLVGHSMGCLISARFSSTHDVFAQVLVSPPIIKKSEVAKIKDKFYKKTYSNLKNIVEKDSIKHLAAFIEKLSSFRKKYMNTPAFEHLMNNIILSEDNFDTLKNIETPTYIIHGRLDPLVIGKNLEDAAKSNKEYVKLVRVMSSHDISASKYDKIEKYLRKVSNEII